MSHFETYQKTFQKFINSKSIRLKEDFSTNKTLRKNTSSFHSLNAMIYGNIFLVYKNRSSRWEYNYELKKLLFYLKLLPNYKNLKILRIFPPHVKVIVINLGSKNHIPHIY